MVLVRARSVSKSFRVHGADDVELPVLREVNLDLFTGECTALLGGSGVGKSTLLRLVYGNYRCSSGSIQVLHDGATVDIASATGRTILAVRRRTVGLVSQFLRVLPRVSALDVVAEPMAVRGVEMKEARERAAGMLARLNIGKVMWRLSPLTFSGGEQQRINLARCFAGDYPIVLLDEPTASLDKENALEVVALIEEAKARGGAVLGVFHDEGVRESVSTKFLDVESGEMVRNG